MSVRGQRGNPGTRGREGNEVRTVAPGRGTVVVLDDDRLFRDLAVRTLLGEGYSALGVSDAAALASAMQASPVDVILADSRLGDGSDGWREANALAEQHGAVVVAVSGYAADAIEATGGSLAPSYLLKGGTVQQLVEAVELAMRSRRG